MSSDTFRSVWGVSLAVGFVVWLLWERTSALLPTFVAGSVSASNESAAPYGGARASWWRVAALPLWMLVVYALLLEQPRRAVTDITGAILLGFMLAIVPAAATAG